MLWEEPPALLGGGERERQGVGPRGDVAALYWRLSRQSVGSTQGENRKHAAYSGNKEPPTPVLLGTHRLWYGYSLRHGGERGEQMGLQRAVGKPGQIAPHQFRLISEAP